MAANRTTSLDVNGRRSRDQDVFERRVRDLPESGREPATLTSSKTRLPARESSPGFRGRQRLLPAVDGGITPPPAEPRRFVSAVRTRGREVPCSRPEATACSRQ